MFVEGADGFLAQLPVIRSQHVDMDFTLLVHRIFVVTRSDDGPARHVMVIEVLNIVAGQRGKHILQRNNAAASLNHQYIVQHIEIILGLYRTVGGPGEPVAFVLGKYIIPARTTGTCNGFGCTGGIDRCNDSIAGTFRNRRTVCPVKEHVGFTRIVIGERQVAVAVVVSPMGTNKNIGAVIVTVCPPHHKFSEVNDLIWHGCKF